jgi:DNA-3-methyladenine glycosylase II
MNKKIINHFKKYDLILYPWVVKVGELEIIKKDKPENYFFRLCREIVCQQLSDKSGNAIFGRFQKLFPNGLVTALDILSISHDQLRASGMSHAKARYVRNLAETIIHGDLPIYHLDSMADEEILEALTKVKGIGPWTAQMFLMFTLGREDIFSHGDLGLKKGIMKIYKFEKEPTKKQIEKIISKWSPYKTYASRILWTSLEID